MPIQPATLVRNRKTKTDTWDKVVGLNFYESRRGPAIVLIHERRISTPRKDTIEVYPGPTLFADDHFVGKVGIPYILILTTVKLMAYFLNVMLDYEAYYPEAELKARKRTKK